MPLSAASVGDLSAIVGTAGVREAAAGDAIDGVAPGLVVEPPTAEALAAVLAWCSTARQQVVIRGGASKIGWGRRPASIDLVVSTRALDGISRYEPGDLTVTVGAGTSVEDLNRALASERQWLPIDVRSSATTIGGAIATNDSGPLRHRYGAPRDQLIGIRLATADGRLASAGGNVVKNVAGYDLGKLVAGSFGSLAAIVSATFKVAPVPAASSTLVFTFGDGRAVAGATAGLSASQLDPLSVEVETSTTGIDGRRSRRRLLVRFAGTSRAVDEQIAAAEHLVAAFQPSDTTRVAGEADGHLWRDRVSRFWAESGAVVKASWMPAALADVIALVDDLGQQSGCEIEIAGRAALGTGVIRVAGDATAEIAVVEMLRSRADTVGHVVVVRGSAELKARVDVWGLSEGTAVVSRFVKQALDPAGILNASRGPA